MGTKLTLVMEPSVIETAKHYARTQQTSVSKLVEQYLALVASSKDPEGGKVTKLGPLTSSLAGAVKPRPADRQKSAKELIGDAKMGRFG